MNPSASLAVALVALASTASLAADSGDPAGAAQFRGGADHRGVYSGHGPESAPRLKWKLATGGAIYSSPAVAGGVVYVGSNDHNLYAVDAADGSVRWKFETRARIPSSPAVGDGLVYFGSYDGWFYAVDAASGELRWKFQTAGERRFAGRRLHGADPAGETMPDPFDFYLSSPALWNGMVFFGSGDNFVYALDAATGQQKWKNRTSDVVHASPAVAGGMLFVGSWDANFLAFDAATGQYKWHFTTGTDPIIRNQQGIQSSAAVADGVVYFGCRDAHLYALDAATGEKKWAVSTGTSWIIGSPAVRDGRVWFATSDTGKLYAVDAASGEELVTYETNRWPLFSSPALAGDRLYVGTHQGRLLALDPSTLKLAWSFETDGARKNGATYTTPEGQPNYQVAFDDFFYDSMVIGLSRMLSVGAVLSSPAVADGVVYFGSADGTLYALE